MNLLLFFITLSRAIYARGNSHFITRLLHSPQKRIKQTFKTIREQIIKENIDRPSHRIQKTHHLSALDLPGRKMWQSSWCDTENVTYNYASTWCDLWVMWLKSDDRGSSCVQSNLDNVADVEERTWRAREVITSSKWCERSMHKEVRLMMMIRIIAVVITITVIVTNKVVVKKKN